MDKQFEQTRKFWGEEIVRGNLLYPDTYVIRFIKKNYKDKSNTTILDFGCGLGRNTFALAHEGYNMIAMDYTEEAVDAVNKKKEKLPIEVIKNSGLNITLDKKVDAIFADGSMFCNSIADTVVLLKNLKSVLKSGGKFWADWRSKEDSMYGKGIKISEGLYILDEGTKREGCMYLFCDEKQIRNMYNEAGFSIESIDTLDYTENDKKNHCSYYHVVAIKK